MFNALRKTERLKEVLPSVRDTYDPSYLDGRHLNETPGTEFGVLMNLLIQGEVSRLAVNDLLEETRALHETQKLILEEMRAARAAGQKA